MDPREASAWMKLVETYGLPLVLLFLLISFLAIGGWLFVRWLRPRMDQLVDATVGLIDTLNAETKRHSDGLKAVQADLGELRAYVARAADRLLGIERHGESLEVAQADISALRVEIGRVSEKLDRIERHVERGAART